MLDRFDKLINKEVRIETTNFCNADCTICSHSTMKRKKGLMHNDAFRNLVEQAKDLGAKLISPFGYGEPLLDNALSQKIQMCTDLGIDTFITTNGALATPPKMIKLFDAGLGHVRFSIHGINQMFYESVHRGLLWGKTTTNLFNTIELKKDFPDIKISITAMPLNGETVKQIRDTWEPCVDWLEIWKPHNWNNKNKYREETEDKLVTCGRPLRGPVQIEWDGSVIPCCFLTNNELVLGNTRDNSIVDILKGDAYVELRERHRAGDLKGLPCEHCDQLFNDDPPLLYSNRNEHYCRKGTTSSLKYNLLEGE